MVGLLSRFSRARYDEENHSTDNPLFQRRVATDDDAVQVVTGHSSKGLEYPLVWMFGFTKGEPSPSFLIHPERPVTRYAVTRDRSEEHTSELQSRGHLVCRLLLEKQKIT